MILHAAAVVQELSGQGTGDVEQVRSGVTPAGAKVTPVTLAALAVTLARPAQAGPGRSPWAVAIRNVHELPPAVEHSRLAAHLMGIGPCARE
jgi:hypothetical protein